MKSLMKIKTTARFRITVITQENTGTQRIASKIQDNKRNSFGTP